MFTFAHFLRTFLNICSLFILAKKIYLGLAAECDHFLCLLSQEKTEGQTKVTILRTHHFVVAKALAHRTKDFRNILLTSLVGSLSFRVVVVFGWRMLKAPPLKSSDLHFLVIKYHCRSYDDNIGPKLKKLLFWGRIICSTISSTSIGPRFVQKYQE